MQIIVNGKWIESWDVFDVDPTDKKRNSIVSWADYNFASRLWNLLLWIRAFFLRTTGKSFFKPSDSLEVTFETFCSWKRSVSNSHTPLTRPCADLTSEGFTFYGSKSSFFMNFTYFSWFFYFLQSLWPWSLNNCSFTVIFCFKLMITEISSVYEGGSNPLSIDQVDSLSPPFSTVLGAKNCTQ